MHNGQKVYRIVSFASILFILALLHACGDTHKDDATNNSNRTIGDVVDSINKEKEKSMMVCDERFSMMGALQHAFSCGNFIVQIGDFKFDRGIWKVPVMTQSGNYKICGDGDSVSFPSPECKYRVFHVVKVERDSNIVHVRVTSMCGPK